MLLLPYICLHLPLASLSDFPSLRLIGRRHARICEKETLCSLAGLQMIFISHMHPDHHIGLPQLLVRRAAALGHPSSATRCRSRASAPPRPRWPWWPWGPADEPQPHPPSLDEQEAPPDHNLDSVPAKSAPPLLIVAPRFLFKWLARYAAHDRAAA
eukprot:SAG11_NODE_9_length_28972_cov_81.532539_19_plen_156_part_00